MARFDYSKLETQILALDYMLDKGKCPECMSKDIDAEHSYHGEIFELKLHCNKCSFTIVWGRNMDVGEFLDFEDTLKRLETEHT